MKKLIDAESITATQIVNHAFISKETGLRNLPPPDSQGKIRQVLTFIDGFLARIDYQSNFPTNAAKK